jgi:trk system potassium uptake protein
VNQPGKAPRIESARRRRAGLGGVTALLLTLAPVAVLLSMTLVRPAWALPVGIASAVSTTAGALWHERTPYARWLALVGLVLVPIAAFDRLATLPALTLGILCALSVLVWLLWDLPIAGRAGVVDYEPSAGARRLAALRAASLSSLLIGFLVTSTLGVSGLLAPAVVVVCFVVAFAFVAIWLFGPAPRRARWLIGTTALVAVGGGILFRGGGALASLALVPGLALLVARADADESQSPPWLSAIVDHPSRLVVTTFLALSLVGTALLVLPISSASGASIAFIDAIFTAVSAVCVTGLIVLDTPTAFSAVGQFAILLLIQVGGLGIMSFYTVALQFLGRRLSLRHELTVAGAAGVADAGSLFGALRRVLIVTFSAELVGAALLFVGFTRAGDGVGLALWRALFTAISGFCNAGFALQSDSLVGYQSNPIVLYTVAGLIVLGGLSPLAITLLPELVRRRRIPIQVKLIYAATACLLLFGTIAFAAFEWSGSLAHLSRLDRAHNAWFQSVTLRTAGFNSIELGETHTATRTLMIVLMLVGGSPGGTAGGLKTTTATVLVLAVVAAMRGRSQVIAFGRRIEHTSVYKATAVATVGILTTLAGIIALELTQQMPFDVGVFEVVSAIGTVGLSLGGTLLLDEVGKVIVTACMFLGRVGPLTLFLFLADRADTSTAWAYPPEDVDVG